MKEPRNIEIPFTNNMTREQLAGALLDLTISRNNLAARCRELQDELEERSGMAAQDRQNIFIQSLSMSPL